MKKLGIMIMAFALVTVFMQCKKEQPEGGNDTPILVGETYSINLSLSSSNGGKSGVAPNDDLDIAPVHYEVGDTMHVAYNGQWVGTLKCTYLSDAVDINGDRYGVFEGEITLTKVGDQPLYFYFFGNRKPVVSGDNNDVLTVDISDQRGELPVVSYAPSVQNFSEEVASYTVQYNWLMNQCALVKFECENIYDMSANSNDNNPHAIYTTKKDITIFGMDNQVTVNLGGNGDDQFSWGQKENSRGAITLFCPANEKADSVRYAIVHHMDYSTVTEGELEVAFDPASDQYGFFGTYKIAHNVVKNAYFDNAKLDLVWHSGAFSVAAASNPAALDIDPEEYGSPYYVVFSRGNLQYNYNQNKWRFAKHQYDFVGGGLLSSNNTYIGNVVLNENDASSPAMSSNSNANRSDNEQINNSGYLGWIDLYGWGTGDNPMKCRQENSNYQTWHEWGNHPIANDGTSHTSGYWYTLGRDEWQYLIEHRLGGSSSAASRIGLAVVEGVKGLILLPDLFNTAQMPAGCPAWEEAGSQTWVDDSWNMTFTAAQWKLMEQKGAAFFPAAGYRGSTVGSLYDLDFDGGGPTGTGGRDQDHGAYWSSTKRNSTSSFELRFGNNITNNHVNPGYYMAPDNGHAVRLAHRIGSSRSVFNLFNK